MISIMRMIVPLAVSLALAGCGSSAGTSDTAAAPVKSVAPPAGKAWVDVVTATPEGGYVQGNPDAPVKLVEYGSRLCPVCGNFAAEGVGPLRAGPIAQGKLSYEFRDYAVHGAVDLGPIALGRCVAPTAFFPILDQMFANQQKLLAKEQEVGNALQAMQKADPGMKASKIATYFADNLGYTAFVKQFGVTDADAHSCLANDKTYDQISARMSEATQKYNISGTPTFIVNGNVIPNVSSWDALKPALQAAGAL